MISTYRSQLYAYETGLPLRDMTEDEWATYQALMDSYTPAAKEHGVVEGAIFGTTGLVYARRACDDMPQSVTLVLAPAIAERLRSLAQTNGVTVGQVVEFLVMQHPRWAPVDPNAPFEPGTHLEIAP
jgi:hypothetical protein